MTTINIGCTKAMPCSPDSIGSIAFNGGGFALISPRCCGITALDEALCHAQTTRTARRYTHLCYDAQRHCYWAAAEESPSVLYRLDTEFYETGKLTLSGSRGRRLCGISADECCHSILLAFLNCIERVDMESGACEQVLYQKCAQLNMGIEALCGGYVLVATRDGMQYITAHCPGCGQRAELCIPRGYSFVALFTRGHSRKENGGGVIHEISLLLRKTRECGLTEMQLSILCSEGSLPPSPQPCPPVPRPYPPVPCPCPPSPRPCPPSPRPCPPVPCPCPPSPCPCPPVPCPCPPVPCPCPPVPCPCPPVPPYPPVPCLPCACGKYEIMHSVALEEAGIAHILNAEGEKLQKAVAQSTSIDELLCVNESVRRTITQITMLEGQLYSKLETLCGICDEPCPNPPCPHPPCPNPPCPHPPCPNPPYPCGEECPPPYPCGEECLPPYPCGEE